ncbi:SsrA-binding protein SmpB [Haploplasma modicum]|uniref:SsrA-binding protein SmpB n=1 Tax=Haploplasma modicum TaxID=2150 RepID=UPI000479A1FF|nr:SsrA-binding protein SmpB [Haploplasma modicum]MCR1809237.1 SsrA-binding protein SmpB [Haploplasma modicum]
MKIIAKNKLANYNYFVLEKYEAGLKLVGSEIKSIRLGKVSINEAYITFKGNEAYVTNMNVSTYEQANMFNHQETRPRKLLLNKREIIKLQTKVKEEGNTVIPLSLYLKNGYAKLEIALAKGKKNYDKREDLKKKDQEMHMKKAVFRY